MADPALYEPPALTMPKAEAAALTEAYLSAGTILEYGSGGSTVLAAGRARGLIISVESDALWLDGLREWFRRHPPKSRVVLHHADIGPTRGWGFPRNRRRIDAWPGYALSVWDRPDFEAPDLVLVDGRFRLACMLTTLYAIERPTVMLVDDYAARPAYHRIETLTAPPQMIGRMARFDLSPMTDLPADQEWIPASFADPS